MTRPSRNHNYPKREGHIFAQLYSTPGKRQLYSTFGKSETMQTELLKISGMACDGCTSKVTHALKTITGVSDAKVSLLAGEATVQYDERLTSPDQLKSAVERAGYGVNGTNAVHSHQSKGGCCT
jgi:copper chaperone